MKNLILSLIFLFLLNNIYCKENFEMQDDKFYIGKGEEAASKKNYELAVSYFSKAIKLNPNSFSAYAKRGDALVNMKLPEEAIADYNVSVKIYPDDKDLQYKRAILYYDMKEYNLALWYYISYVLRFYFIFIFVFIFISVLVFTQSVIFNLKDSGKKIKDIKNQQNEMTLIQMKLNEIFHILEKDNKESTTKDKS